MFRKAILLFLVPCALYAIEGQVSQEPGAIVPWFTGPLIAPPPTTVPFGSYNVEPYLFASRSPAVYNDEWRPHTRPTLWDLSLQVPVYAGIATWADVFVLPTVHWSHQPGAGGAWSPGDLVVQCDFQLYRDQLPSKNWIPSIKIALRETFPTGEYRNLDPKKIAVEGWGTGSWTTALHLVIGKLFHMSSYYYISTRLSCSYAFSAPVHVKGFNVYGGGFGANGTVYPGQKIQSALGVEITLSRNWAFSLDAVGTWQGTGRFSGKAGVVPARFQSLLHVNRLGSMAQYSVAPAIEYNFNFNAGIIAGVWFTVAGKNIAEFCTGVIAFNYFK